MGLRHIAGTLRLTRSSLGPVVRSVRCRICCYRKRVWKDNRRVRTESRSTCLEQGNLTSLFYTQTTVTTTCCYLLFAHFGNRQITEDSCYGSCPSTPRNALPSFSCHASPSQAGTRRKSLPCWLSSLSSALAPCWLLLSTAVSSAPSTTGTFQPTATTALSL